MNKADIVNALRLKRLDTLEDKQHHSQIVDDVLDIIKEFLQAGHNVTVANFGTFKCNSMPPRKARNPKTGEKIQLEKHMKITFKPSPQFKKGIKEK